MPRKAVVAANDALESRLGPVITGEKIALLYGVEMMVITL
jgi:hypothetical protein